MAQGVWTQLDDGPISTTPYHPGVCSLTPVVIGSKCYITMGWESWGEGGEMYELDVSTTPITYLRRAWPVDFGEGYGSKRRYDYAAVAIDNKVLIIGGNYNMGTLFASMVMFDPATNTWTNKWTDGTTTLAPMPSGAREGHRAVNIGNKVWVFGGTRQAVEVYDYTTNTWTIKGNMPYKTDSFGCVSIGTNVWVIGGRVSGSTTGRVMKYDTLTDTWTTLGLKPMPTPRNHFGYGVINGNIICASGTTSPSHSAESSTVVDAYNPSTNQWSANMTSIPEAKSRIPSFVYNNKLFIHGGWNAGSMSYTNYMLDPQTPSFAEPTFVPLDSFDYPNSGDPRKKDNLDFARTRANEFRAVNGLSVVTWTDPVITAGLTGTRIKAVHWNEVNAAIDEVYTTTGQPYPDPNVQTKINTEITPNDAAYRLKQLHDLLLSIMRSFTNS